MWRTFVAGENLRSLGVLFDILDVVNQDRHLREEGIVLREVVCLLRVTARSADVEDRLDVGVDKPGTWSD